MFNECFNKSLRFETEHVVTEADVVMLSCSRFARKVKKGG